MADKFSKRCNYVSGYRPSQSKSNCCVRPTPPLILPYRGSQNVKASSTPTRSSIKSTRPSSACRQYEQQCNAAAPTQNYFQNQCNGHRSSRSRADYQNFLLTLNPKIETRALEFIQRNPTADGRGVIIAILDTGVDPGAAGLKQTTDGKVKVLERYDGSGAGDVDMSTIVNATAEITLLSGRTFPIPTAWHNPQNEYRIGFKPVFHLYPADLAERMTCERRETLWNPAHRKAVAKEEAALEEYQRQMIALSKNETTSGHITSNELSIDLHMTMQEKFTQAEIIAKVEMLRQLDKVQYKNDDGPYLDCILFKDEADIWQVCLAPVDIEDLDKAILLHEYNLYHEYSPLSLTDQFNVSVNVWNDGNVLEIVGMSDSHGTHVASIAAGYFPDMPELNGVAPGAQIISLSLGDARLESQETGTSYARAFARICDGNPKIHIINTSYGEPTVWTPAGNLAKMMVDVVDKMGVVWLSAGGNVGPCLSTTDAPTAIAEDVIIGVAPYVSPEMMTAHSESLNKGPGQSYTWSSRGPNFNGAMGINVCAPGGAVTSVPNYTLSATTLMEGSSMATPHAAGCVALILSLAIQNGIEWTPYSVKRSLEVSAVQPEISEPFSQGYGLIQVTSAYRMLELLSTQVDRFVRHSIVCSNTVPGYEMHGIYIRDPKIDAPKDYTVYIDPIFFQSDTIDPSVKINYRQHLSMVTDANWVVVPQHFELHSRQRKLIFRVNPVGLAPGVYYTRVKAIDSNIPQKGSLFDIDVTLIIPIPICYSPIDSKPRVNFGTSLYTQGQLRRYFIEAPTGATWAVLRLKTTHSMTTEPVMSSFVVHALTIVPGETFKFKNEWVHIKMVLNEERKMTFAVQVSLPHTGEKPHLPALSQVCLCPLIKEGKIVEIAIGRWWPEGNRALDSINLTASVKFRGIKIPAEIATATHNVITKVDIMNLISSEQIMPSAKLTHQVELLKPIEMNLITLTGPRDEIRTLDKFMYELQISYKFTIDNCTEIEVECPMLSPLLYESDYLSQLWMLFDCHKRYIASGDHSPSIWSCELPPGNYILRLQVRHENVNALYRFMLPFETGKTRDLSKCKMNTTRTYNCGGQILPLLSVLLRMTLDSSINLYCCTTLYDAVEYHDCNDDKPENDDEEHMNCPRSDDFPVVMRKNDFMTCYIKTVIDESMLEDFPSSTTSYLEGKLRVSEHHDGRSYCTSKLKVYFPPNGHHHLGIDEEIDAGEDEHESMALHISPTDLLVDISNPDKHLKKLNKIDLSIDYLILNKYFALAVKILLHRRKLHGEAWTKSCDAKLRICFENLGWTHCIYFLDSNSIVQNPPGFRPF